MHANRGPDVNVTVSARCVICGGWGHLRPGVRAVKDRPFAMSASSACSRAGDPLGSPQPCECERAMKSILDVILLILQIYVWLLIASAILSWLVAFNVVNTRNQVVATIGEFLFRITEPVLRPIRSVIPTLGGIDVSPVILILIIFFLQNVIVRYIYPNVF
jgi:YggT family protein